MVRLKRFFILSLFLGFNISVQAALNPANYFQCRVTSTGQLISENTPNTAIVRVNLTPELQSGQNLIVDLTNEIMCKNNTIELNPGPGTSVSSYGVYATVTSGSTLSGALSGLKGSIFWRNETFPLPLTQNAFLVNIDSQDYSALPFKLFLSPIGAAGGVIVKANTLIATVNMRVTTTNSNRPPKYFTWNIYANNDVVIPTGGCDVSARDLTVNLPDYPTNNMQVPLSVHCTGNQNLSFYLTGSTATGSSTIFSNAYAGGAKGIGIQLIRSGGPISVNQKVTLGTVGTSQVDLGLSANYALTNTESLTAGSVQSIIGVTFTYD